MNPHRSIATLILLSVLACSAALAQQKTSLGDNAALRYWAAFAQMKDSSLTDEEAKKLSSVLDGTSSYDDSQYKDLVEKNRPALEIMVRAAKLSNCNWGLDYQMGPDTPQEYVRKALALGRLNVLYSFHLLSVGDEDKALNTMAGGIRFSRDIANGGTLFATLVAKSLLVAHFRVMAFALQAEKFSAAQRSILKNAIAQLEPDGLDWRSAMQRELEIPRGLDPQAASALVRIIPSYVGVLSNPATLSELRRMIANAPQQCSEIIPKPERVLEAKQDLTDKLREMRSKLQ